MIGNGKGLVIDPEFIVIDTVEKWGEQIDVDVADGAAGQIIWPIKATVQQYLFLDTAIQLYLRSNNEADTVEGIGARTVSGSYQDNNGNSVDLNLDTNGTTNVPLPTTSFGVFRFSVESTGSSNKNLGQLQIVDGSNNIYAIIEPEEGQTQIAVFRIPNNRKGRIKYHQANYARAANNNDATMRLRIRKVDGTIITKWDPSISTIDPDDEKRYKKGIDVNPGEWVFWECILVSANDTPIRGSFDIDMAVNV